jgi:hypothetical protein
VVDLSWTELTDACQFIIFTPLFLNLRAFISHCLRMFRAIFICMYMYMCLCGTAVSGVFSSSMGINCIRYMNCVWCVVHVRDMIVLSIVDTKY